MTRLALTAVLFAAASPAFAQGSRSGGIPPAPDLEAHTVYSSLDGTLRELDPEEGYAVAVFQSEDSEALVKLTLAARIKLEADKGSRLHGVEDLRLEDFLVGDRVRFTVRARDAVVVEMKLRKARRPR